MTPRRQGPDRLTAPVVSAEPGLWTFRVDAWSDPWSTWRHAVTVKLDAGQSPDELANDLEVGARLLQRVGRRPGERNHRDLLFGAATARPGRACAVPCRPDDHDGAPDPGADHAWPSAADLCRPGAGALRLLVRVLPPLDGRPRRDRPRRARLVRHGGQGARPGSRDGLRRGLSPADPPDRHGAPQGPQQLRERGPGRRRLPVGHRLGGG